jgi:hypothetical protein
MIGEIVVDEEFIRGMGVFRVPDRSKGLLEACSESVVLFSEFMLGIRLRAWQVFVLRRVEARIRGESSIKNFAWLTSRQVGKSWAISVLALWLLVFNKHHGGGKYGNTQVGVVSASDDQAKKLLNEIKRFMRLGDKFMSESYNGEFGSEFFSSLLDGQQPNNTTTITFRAYDSSVHGEFLLKGSRIGSYVVSLPPTSGILGYTFSLLLIDEAGRSQKITDEFFIDLAGPTTDELDAITIYTSTPWQPSGRFYEVVLAASEGRGSFDVVKFTIDCIKVESPERWERKMQEIKLLNEEGKSDSVRRAYYCEFVKGELSYFDPERVLPVFSNDLVFMDGFVGECDMGVDFGGQVKSRTVVTISRLNEDGVIERLYHKSYPVGKDLSLLEDIEVLLGRFNVQRIIPDDCAAGFFLINQMREKGWNVTPMNFRTDKVKKYGAFRSMVNKGLVKSYLDDELLTEMYAIENSQGSRQSVISAPPGYNDDLIDSFVMSCYYFLVEDLASFGVFDWDDVE